MPHIHVLFVAPMGTGRVAEPGANPHEGRVAIREHLPHRASSPFSASSTLPRTNSFNCPLVTSSFSCTIFSDMVFCLLSEWCIPASFYQRTENHVSFLAFLFAHLIVSYRLAECLLRISSISTYSVCLQIISTMCSGVATAPFVLMYSSLVTSRRVAPSITSSLPRNSS